MQAGDSEEYNNCFAEGPYKLFQPQMVYQMHIYFVENGKYRAEFMIHRNDGCLWRDVGSDATLPRLISFAYNENMTECYISSIVALKTTVVK